MERLSHGMSSPESGLLSAGAVTFVPGEPARSSWFACWNPDDPGGLLSAFESDEGEAVDVTVLVPAKRGVRATMVATRRLDMGCAIDALAALGRADDAVASAHAWADVVRFALLLVAEGRVLPWISPDGYDTWRVDPLSYDHRRTVQALAAALPFEAHAVPVNGDRSSGRRLVGDPAFAVRSVLDAVADRFLRTPAAPRVGSLRLFADPEPTRAYHLRPWVHDLAVAHCAGCRLVIDMEPAAEPAGVRPGPSSALADQGPGAWTGRFRLRGVDDPSLMVDADRFWSAPSEITSRFGDEAELVLLTGLRTVAELVPGCDDVLGDQAPGEVSLDDHQLEVLLDRLDALADRGVEVRWPVDLVAPRLERRLVASVSAPAGSLQTVFDLERLLTVDWEFLLDGVPLTVEELRVLGQAKRALVPVRGRWIRLDPGTRRRLTAPPPGLSAVEVLASVLARGVAAGGADTADGASDGGGEDGLWFQTEPEHDGPAAISVTAEPARWIRRVAELSRPRPQPEPLGLRAELRPYQRRGLGWMADLVSLGLGGCLADDMGLGKTIQVLALHCLLAERGSGSGGDESGPGHAPTLVVAPTSLLANWKREAARFAPDIPVRVYHGQARDLDGLKPDELVVTSYGVVRSDIEFLMAVDWGLVVADEAQQAKNPRSSTAKALRRVPSRARIALTGTPVENRLSELWSIMDWAVPGLLGPLATFRRLTAVPVERDGDATATDRLTRVLEPFLLRRRKSDPAIAPELPEKIEGDMIVPLTPEQATLYRAEVDETLAQVGRAEGIQRRGLVLALLTRLKQITNHPAQYLGEAGPVDGRSGKLEALDDVLTAAVDSGEAALVFTQYVAMGRLLERHLSAGGHRVGFVHGGLSAGARQRLVDRFQAGELGVLVLSLKAAGTGLNLTAATTVIHYDRWWNPAVEDQATDRAYRIGQTDTVTVHRLVTQGTVEDRVAELLGAKRELADRVIGEITADGEAWIGDLDDAELARLVDLDTDLDAGSPR